MRPLRWWVESAPTGGDRVKESENLGETSVTPVAPVDTSLQYEMPEFVGFQTMDILVLYGITFDTVGVFGLAFHLLFKSCSTYCAGLVCKEQTMS